MTATPYLDRDPLPTDSPLVGYNDANRTQIIALRRASVDLLVPSNSQRWQAISFDSESGTPNFGYVSRYIVIASSIAGADNESIVVADFDNPEDRDNWFADNAEAWLS